MNYLVGPRPLEGRGVLWTLGGWGGGVGWGGVGVGWGMYERSCELAESKIFRCVSNIAGTQTLGRSWKSSKDFLPAHMVLSMTKTVGIPLCTLQ